MKRLILLLLFAASTLVASAQIGAKAGINIASLKGDDAEDTKALIGFYLGLYYNAVLSGNISFQPEIVYSVKGAKIDGTDGGKLVLSYADITALMRYNFASGLFIGTGPQLGLLLAAKAKDDDDSEDIKEFFKSTNFAWAFALGYMSGGGIGFYVRYDLGLAQILEAEGSDMKTSVIAIGLRYNFGGGGGQARKVAYLRN